MDIITKLFIIDWLLFVTAVFAHALLIGEVDKNPTTWWLFRSWFSGSLIATPIYAIYLVCTYL